jgi:hypothetical protein
MENTRTLREKIESNMARERQRMRDKDRQTDSQTDTHTDRKSYKNKV